MFLTHYSRVGEVQRLADDLHACLDEFVAIARSLADAPERRARMGERMLSFLDARLIAHGHAGDEAARHAMLGPDVQLNVQGLEVWLTQQST
jgi:hypothetical protein